jgi:NEDD8-activating enzyme E1 regulatory subunit
MNPDVEGRSLNMSVEKFLSSGYLLIILAPLPLLCMPTSIPFCLDLLLNKTFTLVIASNLPESILLPLAAILQGQGTPLVVQQSYGLLGSVRVQTSNHFIIESKPDSEKIDLRIAQPFVELESVCATYDFQDLDSRQHSHIPFVIILAKATSAWKSMHDDRLPTTTADKDKFKELIVSMRRDADEVNFIEALKFAYYAYSNAALSPEVQDLIDAQSGVALSANSQDFR